MKPIRLPAWLEMSLTTRLLFGFALIAALGFALMLDTVLERVERQYLEAAEEPMVDFANVLAELMARDMTTDGKMDPGALEAALSGARSRTLTARIHSVLKTQVDLSVYVTDEQGRVLFDSLHPEQVGKIRHKRDVMLSLMGSYGARSTREVNANSDSVIMYVGAPIQLDGKILGVVSVGKPESSMNKFRDETRAWLKRTLGTLTICMVLCAFLLARWTTRPIRRLTDYARAISRGEKPPMPHLHGPEMKTLGRAFDTMRDTLENREYVEHYVQTLTHELKSPVAAIRGASELLQESSVPEPQRTRFLRNIQSETLRLQDLIDRLLALAALEKQKTLENPADVSLSELAEQVSDRFGPMFAQRRLRLDLWIEKDVEVRGDPFLLQTAMNNLVQNAIDFSPEGGTVSLGLKSEGRVAFFIVEDDGPGLPAFAHDRVFERFYSLPRPTSGKKSSGLGLCFVKEAALLHSGSVALENRDGGVGARALLTLPLA